jgi:DNA-directed RNA polymerase specialized sigma24 family protein
MNILRQWSCLTSTTPMRWPERHRRGGYCPGSLFAGVARSRPVQWRQCPCLGSCHHAKHSLHLAWAQPAESAGGNRGHRRPGANGWSTDAGRSLIEKADAAALELAIGALPPPFKETLVLRDINGLSYREISDITGVPLGTVMSRLARARGLLMAALGSGQSK